MLQAGADKKNKIYFIILGLIAAVVALIYFFVLRPSGVEQSVVTKNEPTAIKKIDISKLDSAIFKNANFLSLEDYADKTANTAPAPAGNRNPFLAN